MSEGVKGRNINGLRRERLSRCSASGSSSGYSSSTWGPSFRFRLASARASLPRSNDRTYIPIDIISVGTKRLGRQHASDFLSAAARFSSEHELLGLMWHLGNGAGLWSSRKLRHRVRQFALFTCARVPVHHVTGVVGGRIGEMARERWPTMAKPLMGRFG